MNKNEEFKKQTKLSSRIDMKANKKRRKGTW